MHPRLVMALGGDANVWLTEWAGKQGDPLARVDSWPAEEPVDDRVLLCLRHPSWAQKRPAPEREAYIGEIAASLRWAFAKGPYEVT